jgi:hypothetical protein
MSFFHTDSPLSWVCGGVVLTLLYIIISNTLWLLLGSRLLQSLPGVHIRGIAGTFKIAAMLVLSVCGVMAWGCKYVVMSLTNRHPKPCIKDEVGRMIQRGARQLNRTKLKR